VFLERKEDLAIYYWLVNSFASVTGMKIVDGFPEDPLTLPTISVDWDETNIKDFQLGDRSGSRLRTWYIDVYAKNKSTRDEFSYKIHNELKDGITVYDIVNGAPTADRIGHLNILQRRIKVVRIDPELVSTMYYRASISILAENDILQED
jgi:hypothetical protein